jgi:hypothetical protein
MDHYTGISSLVLLPAGENYMHENQFMFETHSCGKCKDHLPREVTIANGPRVKFFYSLGGFEAVIMNKTDGIMDLKMLHLLWSEMFSCKYVIFPLGQA